MRPSLWHCFLPHLMCATQSIVLVQRQLEKVRLAAMSGCCCGTAFCATLTRAREAQADAVAEKAVRAAHDAEGDYYLDANGRERFNKENVLRSKLKFDSLVWLAARLAPHRYSERVAMTRVKVNQQPQLASEIDWLTVPDGAWTTVPSMTPDLHVRSTAYRSVVYHEVTKVLCKISLASPRGRLVYRTRWPPNTKILGERRDSEFSECACLFSRSLVCAGG